MDRRQPTIRWRRHADVSHGPRLHFPKQRSSRPTRRPNSSLAQCYCNARGPLDALAPSQDFKHCPCSVLFLQNTSGDNVLITKWTVKTASRVPEIMPVSSPLPARGGCHLSGSSPHAPPEGYLHNQFLFKTLVLFEVPMSILFFFFLRQVCVYVSLAVLGLLRYDQADPKLTGIS